MGTGLNSPPWKGGVRGGSAVGGLSSDSAEKSRRARLPPPGPGAKRFKEARLVLLADQPPQGRV